MHSGCFVKLYIGVIYDLTVISDLVVWLARPLFLQVPHGGVSGAVVVGAAVALAGALAAAFVAARRGSHVVARLSRDVVNAVQMLVAVVEAGWWLRVRGVVVEGILHADGGRLRRGRARRRGGCAHAL